MNLTDLAIALTACTGVSWLLTRYFRGWVLSRSLLDIPNSRSSHSQPTPTGGGLVFAAIFLGAILVLYLWERLGFAEFAALFGSGLVVAIIGWCDDLRPVPARVRLLVHFIAAGWSLYWIGGVPSLVIAGVPLKLGWMGPLLAAFALVWMLNLFNFMDGIDGLAASEAVFVTLAASLLCLLDGRLAPSTVLAVAPLAVLAAGCAGFLIWNWPPAALFMGDVGSGFLGFIIGLLALISIRAELIPLSAWVILCGVFLVDSGVTLVRRILRGEKFYQAHRTHAYQHATLRFKSHRKVTLGVWLINLLWLFPLAGIACILPATGPALVLLAWLPLMLLVYRLDAGVNFHEADR